MADDLYKTGIRPAIDKYLLDEAAKVRDYGDYWSASSAGYCMRKVIFDRLGVPEINPDARKQRVFSAGHIFHSWIQGITRDAGISVAQEVELQDDDLMVRGHFDDLCLVDGNLLLIDYKTQNSGAFTWQKKQGVDTMSRFHRLQLGTYMYMLRSAKGMAYWKNQSPDMRIHSLTEARILKISKDDLRMSEQQLLWSPDLEKDVVQYWSTLNGYWKSRKIPECTCAKWESGFMAKEKYNPYFYSNEPCSLEWYKLCKKEGTLRKG